MGRTVIIGTLMVFAIFNLLLGLGFYLFLKKRKENGQSLYETPVNQQTRTEKLGLGEILVYLSPDCYCRGLCFQTLNRGGVGEFYFSQNDPPTCSNGSFQCKKKDWKVFTCPPYNLYGLSGRSHV